MILSAFCFIGIGATLGAWLRWGLGNLLNPLFPTLPLGTLVANLFGGFLMGLFMALTKDHLFLPENTRLAIATGFFGKLYNLLNFLS